MDSDCFRRNDCARWWKFEWRSRATDRQVANWLKQRDLQHSRRLRKQKHIAESCDRVFLCFEALKADASHLSTLFRCTEKYNLRWEGLKCFNYFPSEFSSLITSPLNFFSVRNGKMPRRRISSHFLRINFYRNGASVKTNIWHFLVGNWERQNSSV